MRLAAERGALTVDADKVVHSLLDSDVPLQEAISRAFGPGVRRQDGRIDRAALGAIVFSDPAALRQLERLTHPAVRRAINEQISASRATVVVLEAIKLLEGELAHECDQIWVTRCSRQLQIERLIVCRGLDWETATMRVNAQAPAEEKIARADVVIDTEGTMADTQMRFDLAWTRLTSGERPAPRPEPVVATPVAAVAAPVAQPAHGPVRSAPPERLTARSAAEVRQRLAPQSEAPREERRSPRQPDSGGTVIVRRARPSDIPSIILLIQRATAGAVKLKRSELLLALGERSYLIGQEGGEITTIMGWRSENMIGRVDQVYVHPLAAVAQTAPPVLDEIERTAAELLCESIFLFLRHDSPEAIRHFFAARDYRPAVRERLPRVWQAAFDESQPADTTIWLKSLRRDRAV
jgi:dephospho-CoA kinase